MKPGAARSRQRGVAALAVSLLLLFAMGLLAFFTHRNLLFEHKASANQYRSTRAFEMAQAGLDWAVAMLNDPRKIDARCQAAAMGLSLRDRYVPSDAGGAFNPATSAHPACRIEDAALACRCPAAGIEPDLASGHEPMFRLSVSDVPGDTGSVRVSAQGCTGPHSPCVPSAAPPGAQASARVEQTLKRKHLLRLLPTAALTAGGSVDVAGVAFGNLDADSNGTLVLAGRGVSLGASPRLATLPGSPAGDAVIENDASLAALAAQGADGAALFTSLFGMDYERLRLAAAVRRIDAGSATGRAASLLAAHAAGYSAFVLDGDLQLAPGSLGSPARPVLIVTRHRVQCSEACQLHGLLYLDVAGLDAGALANLSVHGAIVTRGDHRQARGGGARYAADTLATLQRQTALLVGVPGSWRDP